MEINWLIFVPALALLFYPLDAWLDGRFSLRDYEWLRMDPKLRRRTWWKHPSVWIDPLRAAAGAWALQTCWTVDAGLPAIWRLLPVVATVFVLGIAVLAQMHTRHDDRALFAPVGFLAGVVVGMLPLQVAVLIVAMGIVCLMAFRSWVAFFLCSAGAAGAFGYMILKVNLWVAASVTLLVLPVFVARLTDRPLLFPMTSKSLRKPSDRSPASQGDTRSGETAIPV